MNLIIGGLLVVLATVVTTGAMLLVRRHAPEGSYFTDGDRASGVFGVLATGFSVLLGFIIFLAFESYDGSRTGAEDEATIVVQQVETAQFLPRADAGVLTGELICYARSVVGSEWDAMASGDLGNAFNPWGLSMFRTIQTVHPSTSTQQSAYDRWMDQTSQRQQARVARVHGAEGVIPLPLWLVLLTISAVIFVYLLFFADSGEGAVTQAVLMASVTVVIALLMMLLVFLNRPHGHAIGKLQPTAMERSLSQIAAEVKAVDLHPTIPCDAHGSPL